MGQSEEGHSVRTCKSTCQTSDQRRSNASGESSGARLQTSIKGRKDTYILFDAELGSGTFGHVRLGLAQSSSMEVAVKVINKSRTSAKGQAMIKDEVIMLKTVKLNGCTQSLQLIEAVETSDHLYIITEYIHGGTLSEYSNSFCDGMDEVIAKRIFRNVLLGVQQLHHANICHLDLKLENVLFSPLTSEARICDFGFAKYTAKKIDDGEMDTVLQTVFCGSTDYVAPEICRHHPFDGKQADMWSLGVMLYAMTSGIGLPFPGETKHDVYRSIVTRPLDTLYFPPGMSVDLIDLQLALLDRTPWRRPSVDRVLAHPYLRC